MSDHPIHSPAEGIAVLPLSRGKQAIVDEADLPLLSQYKWHANKRKHTGIWYAVAHVTPNGKGYDPPVLANPGNVIRLNVGGGQMGNPLCHLNEAPFPEALAEFFILSFCPPGGKVCDPFLGSGTTAAVAIRCGRNFTGCDLRQSQVEIARKRVTLETPMLFS